MYAHVFPHTHTEMHSGRQSDRQSDKKTSPLELTALSWMKSLPSAFFVLANLGSFDIGTPQNMVRCPNNGGTLQYKSIRNQKYNFGKQQSSEYNCRFIWVN